MFNNKLLGCLSLATALLFSSGAIADDEDDAFTLDDEEIVEPKPVYTSQIELGIGWQSQDSYKFGEFNGLNERGVFAIGNLRISRRDAWDSGGTEYWTLTGTNLGLDSRNIGFEYGQQGSFKIFASFDQIPKYLFSDGMTPYIPNAAETVWTLPAGWVPNDRNAQTLTTLDESLNPVSIEHRRDKFSGGFSWNIDKHWKFSTMFSHEKKEGTRTIAAIFGSSGGDPGGAIIPEPIDYETNNLDFAIEYASEKAMFSLAFNLSDFDNNKQTLTFQNAFSSTRWADAANYPDGYGLIHTFPNSKAWRVTFQGGYVFSTKTRANVNFNYTHATQNDPFVPYTVNPDLVINFALPQTSLMGERNTLTANFGLTSRVSSKFNVGFDIRFEDRNNNTPMNIYLYTHADSHDQDDTLITGDARINIPYDREQMRFKFNMGYKFSRNVKLGVVYTYEALERTYSEVAKTKEHMVEAKLNFTPTTKTFGWFGVTVGDRNGTGYEHNSLFLASHNPDWIEEEGEEFENHPLIRKFFIADRERLSFKGGFNWLPSDTVVIGLFGHMTKDDYNNTVLGLREQKTASGTFDVAFTPNDAITYHGYVTIESLRYNQASYQYRPGQDLDDFAGKLWTVDTHDKITTFGLGFDWQAIKDKLKFVADFTYSNADTVFFITGGSDLSFLQLPNLNSKLVGVEAKMDYQYRDNVVLRIRYWFQDLNGADFALDNVDPDSEQRIIGLGQATPTYNVHILGFSAIYKF